MTITLAPKALVSGDPISSPLWRDLTCSPQASLFHSQPWLRVIRDTYGFEFQSVVLLEAGRPVAGIPWYESKGLLGQRRVTLPFSDYCDPLVSEASQAAELFGCASDGKTPWALRLLNGGIAMFESIARVDSAHKWHGTELSRDVKSVWEGFSPMAQRAIRKAEKEGVTVSEARTREELRAWYLLHLRLRKYKHRLLAQPFAFFEHIWDQFIEQDQGCLLLARHDGQMIGGTLYLFWGDCCYYKFNASDPSYLPLRPNNLLLWHGVQRAAARGCRLLDLGRSPVSQAGLIAFKRSFGARECEITTAVLGTEEHTPVTREAKVLLHQLTDLFVGPEAPDSVTEQAGSLLYKYFV